MPFFEDIGKKISNMGQTAVEKTKCSTETLRLNNQIREEQRLCKDLYQQIGQQYAQQYETNPDPAFESLMKQLHDAQERITSYQEQIQIKKAAVSQPQQSAYSTGCCCASCGAPLPPDAKFCTTCGAKVELTPPEPVETPSRVCPKCGNHDAARVSVTRRVCGYLGSPDARPFNAGKQEEVKRRVKHLGNGQIG